MDERPQMEAPRRRRHHRGGVPAEFEREAAGHLVQAVDSEIRPSGYLPTVPLFSMSSVHLSPSTRPSASLIETNAPPRSPLFSGLTTIVTWSPALTSVDFQP